MTDRDHDRDSAITVRQKSSDRVLVAAGFPLLGAVAGASAPSTSPEPSAPFGRP